MQIELKRLFSSRKHLAIATALAAGIAGLAFGLSTLTASEAPTPAAAPDPPPQAEPSPVAPEPVAVPAAVVAKAGSPAPPPEPPRKDARITFTTSPPARATVTWGRERLGVIAPGAPLVVTRPRDSGPLDVIVRSHGFLPVQTRAHTFGDTRIVVRLTPPEEQSTLIGYRAPLDAGVDGALPFEPTTTESVAFP